MWAEPTENFSFVQELSKSVVAEVAPEELELFDELVAEYRQKAARPSGPPKSSDDPLGFGVDPVLAAATPVVLVFVKNVLTHLLNEAMDEVKTGSSAAIKEKIRLLFQPKGKPEAAPAHPPSEKRQVEPWTRDQLEQVRKVARKEAIKAGIPDTEADRWAVSLVGALALAK